MVTKDKEVYFQYLNELRESGITNMFGARPYLIKTFKELTGQEALKILTEWIESF